MSATMTKRGLRMRRYANAEDQLRIAARTDAALYQKMAREFISEFLPVGTLVGILDKRARHEVVSHPTEQMEVQDQLRVMCSNSGFETWIPLWKVRVLWKHIYD